jgi:hypothetical protein
MTDSIFFELAPVKEVPDISYVHSFLKKVLFGRGRINPLSKNPPVTLEQAGKQHKEFERPLGTTTAEIVYTSSSGAQEIFMEVKNWNWNSFSSSIKQLRVQQLGDQVESYRNEPGGWDNIRLSSKVKFASEQGITPAVKQMLDDLGVELI